nr:MAG TPA: hypothetical protein [Caudoviricetes sp.]
MVNTHSRRAAQIFDLTGSVTKRLGNPPGFQPCARHRTKRRRQKTMWYEGYVDGYHYRAKVPFMASTGAAFPSCG